MSEAEVEVEAEVPETGPVSVDDVLAAIQQKNLNTAKNHFNQLMSYKVNDALENEKIKIANSVFNDAEEAQAALDAEEEVESEEEETDVESEVESAFEEEEEDAEDN